MLVSVLAEKARFNLRKHAVGLISVEGIELRLFLPLSFWSALKIPVSLPYDADPFDQPTDGGDPKPLYPALGDGGQFRLKIPPKQMKGSEDIPYVKGLSWTEDLEYDLALPITAPPC